MAKDLFGFEDTRTDEEKRIADELNSLLQKYRSKYGMDIDLTGDNIEDRELIVSLKKCINDNIRLSVLYPELVNLSDEYDY